MAEMSVNKRERRLTVRHRGRISQTGIYLGKQLRMFIYQNDWKVLPMSMLIAGLVGMVIRNKLFDSMEGTQMACFALVMVCIWNGCFNSIQVICRERDVIKRQHRSGMHISSYITAHMAYQLLLCLAQTGITLFVTQRVGVHYEKAVPLVTPWFIVDFGISMLLITYASDMMSLWISCLSHNTTTAMTIMPFVLIFQLVFSGGMLTLPAWTEPLTNFTISNPAVKVLTTQANYNAMPVKTIWTTLKKMKDSEVGGTVTVGQILDILEDKENPTVAEIRAYELGGVFTVGEVDQWLNATDSFARLKQEPVLENMTARDVINVVLEADELQPLRDLDFGIPAVSVGKLLKDMLTADRLQSLLDRQVSRATTVGDVLDMLKAGQILEKYKDVQLGGTVTIGELVDKAAANGDVQAMRDKPIELKVKLGKLFDLLGEEKVQDAIQKRAGEAGQKKEYAFELDNIVNYWIGLFGFVMAFALLSMITLEFIDKDKR